MHLPATMWIYSPTWKISEPHAFGIFMEVSSCKHDPTLILFPALLSLENGAEVGNLVLKIPSF